MDDDNSGDLDVTDVLLADGDPADLDASQFGGPSPSQLSNTLEIYNSVVTCSTKMLPNGQSKHFYNFQFKLN